MRIDGLARRLGGEQALRRRDHRFPHASLPVRMPGITVAQAANHAKVRILPERDLAATTPGSNGLIALIAPVVTRLLVGVEGIDAVLGMDGGEDRRRLTLTNT